MMFLSVLPVLLVGLLFLLFSQYYLKNWMQSLYICRTELLKTQNGVGDTLEKLMGLNKQALSLRTQRRLAYIELAEAIAAENPALVSQAWRKIRLIERQQKALDLQQKSLIWTANSKMQGGLQKVSQKLRLQDQKNQALLPPFFSFRIHGISSLPRTLAVRPDQPDTAPIYELENDFTQKQSLNISWISEFQTTSRESVQWISNHHTLKQNCSASLIANGSKFEPTLSEGKR
jgi:hypothetical protein